MIKAKIKTFFLALQRYYFLPVIVAAVMSFISSRYLFVGSGLNLIPWGILALLWGFAARNKSDAVTLGAAYGFSQSFIFLWIDKAGKLTLAQFIALVVIISALSLLAGLCGSLAARLTYKIKASYLKRTSK